MKTFKQFVDERIALHPGMYAAEYQKGLCDLFIEWVDMYCNRQLDSLSKRDELCIDMDIEISTNEERK